ncbi:MAG: hypothetical protein V5A46_09530 [Haloferacaceae archaeon]
MNHEKGQDDGGTNGEGPHDAGHGEADGSDADQSGDDLDRLFPFQEDAGSDGETGSSTGANTGDSAGEAGAAGPGADDAGGGVDLPEQFGGGEPPDAGSLHADGSAGGGTAGGVASGPATSQPSGPGDIGLENGTSGLGQGEESVREDPPKQPAGNRLSTGIEPLDRELDGGIPPGRLVTFVAPPDAQSELLIKELSTQRDTLYLSTIRPCWEIEEELRDHIQRNHDSGGGGQAQIEQLPSGARLETAREHLESLDNRSLLVVNAVNELEAEAENRYAEFLNAVKQALWDTASIGLFYQIKEDEPPPGRTVTLRRADLVWELHKSMQNTGIENYLEISKFRGGSALRDPIKLKLTDEVEIDTSRDIA